MGARSEGEALVAVLFTLHQQKWLLFHWFHILGSWIRFHLKTGLSHFKKTIEITASALFPVMTLKRANPPEPQVIGR